MDQPFLTGKLLVATPQTGGEVFRRGVVLVLHHDADGAHGVVLNRRLDAPVGSVLPAWQEYVTPPDRLFQGGPVGLDTALGLVGVPGFDVDEPMGVRLILGSVGLVDLDTPPVLVMPELSGLRIFAGYSGWGPAQLEEEIRRGGWYVMDAEPRDAFSDEPDLLWGQVLRRQGGNLAFVALYPDDPSEN